jgi:hypothetical protein
MARIDPLWLPMTILGLFAFLGAFMSRVLKRFQNEIDDVEDVLSEASHLTLKAKKV